MYGIEFEMILVPNLQLLPYMVIIGDGKIIDYTTNRSNEKIEKFLKDNNII